MLTVYKASAGSGKTFQLVVEYLKLLIKNPANYKHILAVTFTNKATAEMKGRILEQLYKLAQNQPSDYLEILKKENNSSEETIRENALRALKNILHDYTRFSVNTIDSFTQKVIKSFNRELGISPQFTVELDQELILLEATDNLLSKIGTDKKLRTWLKEFSREKIEENKSQRIEHDISKLGKELFNERFQEFFPPDGKTVYSREKLDNLGKEIRKIISWFESGLKKSGEEIFQIILHEGFSVDDFSYKNTGVAGFIKSVAEGKVKEPGSRVLSALEDSEKWYSDKHKQKVEIQNLVENKLQQKLQELVLFYNTLSPKYYTSIVVLRQLRMLGILIDLKEEIQLILHEKAILQLSDSNLLLSKIIGESEAPFVYEKIGNVYKHFMLDEFQDTSGLQWHNFKPLIENSLSEGYSNLVVGDVKQSIYRWRNSDWNILAEKLDKEFSQEQKSEKSLEKNWRSDKNIIEFNNAVFEALISSFESHLVGGLEDGEQFTEKFYNIYSGFHQSPGNPQKPQSGLATIHFIEEEDFQEESTNLLIKQVIELQIKGVKANEIAILIRKNNEGIPIVERFLEEAQKPENRNYNLTVLSNESLFLFASKSVSFVIGVLHLLVEPANPIIKAQLLQLWETWLKPGLRKKGIYHQTENGQTQLTFDKQKGWQLNYRFTEEFDEELSEKIKTVREKVLLSSTDEILSHTCSVFGLFNFDSEIPFLQTLIDKAGELKTSLSNDLSNFIFWWYEKGYKTPVNINENLDSIRLLTVHKAKGLEFKAVLLPYFDWKTTWSGTNAPILWCEPKTEPFSDFPLLPVQAGENLVSTGFKVEYLTEKFNYYIDTLNLVYVAFTRAKSVLHVNCPAPKETKNPKASKPVNYLLKKALEQISETDKFKNCMDDEKNIFHFGEISAVSEKPEHPVSPSFKKYHFTDFSEKIKLRLSGEDFLVESEKNSSVKNTGKLIHEIMAGIETKNDVKKACTQALTEGLISEEEINDIQSTIERNLGISEVNDWFNGKYIVLNERNLLTRERILRPDRMMFLNDEAIVVDYKTGEIQSGKYDWQVKRYAKILKETGFKKVSSYLWFLSEFTIQKVCEF